MPRKKTQRGSPGDKLNCVVCGIQGIREPATSVDFEEDVDIPNYLSSVYVKPILTELFPRGFGGRPFQYMMARSFILPFCTDCEAEVRGVLSAKIEIENLRKLIDASLNCIRIKVREQKRLDGFPDEDHKILGHHILGIQSTATTSTARNSKEDSTEVSATVDTRLATESESKGSVAKLRAPEPEAQVATASGKAHEKTVASPQQKSTRTRKKPVRFGEAASTSVSPRKAGSEAASASETIETDDLEQVDLDDHSDLIELPVGASDVRDVNADDPDWAEERNENSSKEKEQKSPRKRGRPPGTSKKAPKVIKQIQAPKVKSQLIEPGVYKYKDYVYRSRADGKWQCDTCRTVMKSRYSCMGHINIIHLGKYKGEFECDICHKVYDRRTTLTIHRQIHDGNRFMCQSCGKLFAHKGSFKQHLLIHEGKLDFVCDWEDCGRRFAQSRQLKLHLMRHEDCKPFLCEHCPKRYLLQSELDNHVRTHTGERPYACSFCASRFFIKGRLSRHYRNVHGVSPESVRVNAVLPVLSVPVANTFTEVPRS